MTIQELLNRLNSIAKANPKNKELEVKFCNQAGELSHIDFANLVVDVNNVNLFCAINNVWLNKTKYAAIPDSGWLSNDSLISIGEAFGKSFLHEAAETMIAEIHKCKEESEIPDTIHKETEVIFDECLKRLRELFIGSGQGPLSDVMAISSYISARCYVGENLRDEILKIINERIEQKKKQNESQTTNQKIE